jgi:hypothetical protein
VFGESGPSAIESPQLSRERAGRVYHPLLHSGKDRAVNGPVSATTSIVIARRSPHRMRWARRTNMTLEI